MWMDYGCPYRGTNQIRLNAACCPQRGKPEGEPRGERDVEVGGRMGDHCKPELGRHCGVGED